MTAVQKRKVKTARTIATRLLDRPRGRMHPEYECFILKTKWGVAPDVCEIICSMLKEVKEVEGV